MSYENAPATMLVATHCCVCNRPLVDADSVEMGIGPTCRGHVEPDAEPAWDVVADYLARWVQEEPTDDVRRNLFENALARMTPEAQAKGSKDGRAVSNVLTHYLAVAMHGGATNLGNLIMAVRATGRVRLSDILASRLYDIRIKYDGDDLLLRSPYSDSLRSATRGLHARWDRERKLYRMPATSRVALDKALRAAYPGKRAFGPKGEFSL